MHPFEDEEFYDSEPDEEMDLQQVMASLEHFFQQHGLGLGGTIHVLQEEMDQINQSLVEALDDPGEEQLAEVCQNLLAWSQHIAHLIYYVGIHGDAQPPSGFNQFVLGVPGIQMQLSRMMQADQPAQKLPDLAGSWMGIRQTGQDVLEQLQQEL